MQTFSSIAAMQAFALAQRRAGRRIGFVPTMGFLHAGHVSLMRQARPDCDLLVVSLFVNPTQFGAGEDLNAYPRDPERDLHLCEGVPVDVVFTPAAIEMYVADHSTFVEETALSAGLCGATRPGHFRGVATVVCKLFNIVQPDFAIFGSKDAQQARVIRRMTRDLNLPVEIKLAATVREADGLAMSSRNTYLDAVQRRDAVCLSRALRAAAAACEGGEKDVAKLTAIMATELKAAPSAQVEYAEIVDAETLRPVLRVQRPALALLAVRIGQTRLIDNVELG